MAGQPTTITDRLRQAIATAAKAGVSRYRISKQTGVEQSALSRFMSGERGLDLSSADKLAAYFELELKESQTEVRHGQRDR